MFHSSKIFIPTLTLATRVLKLQWWSKNKTFNPPLIFGSKTCALRRKLQIWSQNLNRITFDPVLLKKTVENWQNALVGQFLTFLAKRGDVIWFQFWDQIWNPLIRAHLLDTKTKGKQTLFFTLHCYFKTLVARGRVEMNILFKWNMSTCFQRQRPR